MTWPLGANLGRAIAGDLADPVFNTWVLLWTSGQVLAFLGGDWSALGRYWHGNIFHPEPYTLAYSEHLTPQMLQALPVIALTGNVLLAYNLLFLASFVLAGLGVYLFVRDITGRPLAAFVAGLAFAWAPYRLAHISHLQILTSYWMPFALVGFQRYFATRRVRPLAGGAAALVLQNLSCGYYLLYFPPFVAAYCLYEIARRRLWEWRVVVGLAVAALAAALVTWPFVEPYLTLRAGGVVGIRGEQEIRDFSADVWALATAPPNLRLWSGHMSAFVRSEGEGFPGLLTTTLAMIAVVAAAWRGLLSLGLGNTPLVARAAGAVAAVVLVVAGGIGSWLLVASGLRVSIGGTLYIFYDPAPALGVALVAALVLAGVVLLTARRPATNAPPGGPVGFFALAFIAATVLSFGPVITSAGKVMMPGPYALLVEYVPGFDGSRVPARFLLLSALFLAILAGLGAAALVRLVRPRAALLLVGTASIVVLAEGWFAPFRLNVPAGADPPLVEPTDLRPGRTMGPLYRVVAGLPEPVVLIEFPFGQTAHDVMAMFYAGHHRRRLVNGYSGYFPERFFGQKGALRDPMAAPEYAARWLADTGATHAVVHEAYFQDDYGPAVSAWLTSLGARLMTADGPDKLFQLK